MAAKRSGTKSTQKSRFLIGTDTPVVRVKRYEASSGRGKMVWAVKEEKDSPLFFRVVPVSETELR